MGWFEVEYKNVDEIRRHCDPPGYDHYKCSECGMTQLIDNERDYKSQSCCRKQDCAGQMMGDCWAGWFNRYRDLAMKLFRQSKQ